MSYNQPRKQLNVNNTMLDKLLSWVAPHYCYNCSFAGTNLCHDCKNYYTEMSFDRCLVCQIATNHGNLCPDHTLPYQRAWCVSTRDETIGRLIEDLKCKRTFSAHQPLADLLDDRLPALPDGTVIVPIPTAPRNIRLRGYDHMQLIARQLARRRGLVVDNALSRQNNTVQHFAKSANQRKEQAKTFFQIRHTIDPGVNYLLIDDIFTTGATIEAGAYCLKQAGAQSIDVAIIARQQ